jgi:hypothetical protein
MEEKSGREQVERSRGKEVRSQELEEYVCRWKGVGGRE